jgi:hypothetical protein
MRYIDYSFHVHSKVFAGKSSWFLLFLLSHAVQALLLIRKSRSSIYTVFGISPAKAVLFLSKLRTSDSNKPFEGMPFENVCYYIVPHILCTHPCHFEGTLHVTPPSSEPKISIFKSSSICYIFIYSRY